MTRQQYKMTVTFPPDHGTGYPAEYRDLEGTREELAALSRVLDALTVGQRITIERIPDKPESGDDPGETHNGWTFDPSREVWQTRTGPNTWREVGETLDNPPTWSA